MDPVSDMFIRMKNANAARRAAVYIPYSRFKLDIAKALLAAGYIAGAEVKGKRARKTIEISLRYENDGPAVRDVRLISKPSRRLYRPYRDLRPSSRGGVIFVSTPKGVLTDASARKEKVGGELIAEVW